jgi:hypothetical protein
VAVTSTWVSPNFTMQEPSAYLTTPRSSDTGRNSSGARRLGRMGNPFEKWAHPSMTVTENRYPLFRIMLQKWFAVLVGGGTGSGKGFGPDFAA